MGTGTCWGAGGAGRPASRLDGHRDGSFPFWHVPFWRHVSAGDDVSEHVAPRPYSSSLRRRDGIFFPAARKSVRRTHSLKPISIVETCARRIAASSSLTVKVMA